MSNAETIKIDMKAEDVRRDLCEEINADPGSRESLEAEHGQVWTSDELGVQFRVEGFAAPCAIVRDRKTGIRGTMMFQHSPRFYFSFSPDQS